MLSESAIRQLFERRYVPANCHLLGDSGYPCKPWLLTPYLQPRQGPQLNYNRAHKTTRAVVERGIGQLKRRFHVLHGEVRLRPEKVSKVIIACAILHNICKVRQIAEPLEDGDEDEDNDEDGGEEDTHSTGEPSPEWTALQGKLHKFTFQASCSPMSFENL
ncbi:hypothetical protein PFLUV_G00274340 [Perca fluviatilis]|uniref:DDE Tnp4 domain-containing protein n=1 Tax=Perca fluviatilis TaxID=8168 RepID=A0A6A5E1R5_PERFL|nr:hypothetical protein PFLUV_G00274340 [Perca fluviatilis]